ncbi:hypothetical protein N7530_010709 [Penicillium desertorum]|uniref:Uncharacterized protein n=1 Tax=Penicillium desertorum TaxID=1303715 RepID=A0A9X0BHW5_9EURO|nr:hypothetical protein N7530_010709 [Penicillium desertorum]
MTNEENMRGNPTSNQSSTLQPKPHHPQPQTTPPTNPLPTAPPSLGTQIEVSATGLAKSAFNQSPDLAQTLASTQEQQTSRSSHPPKHTNKQGPRPHRHGGPGSVSGPGSTLAAQAFRELIHRHRGSLYPP